MTTCAYDSGSMTGCRPLCDAPADHVVTYRTPCYGPFTVPLCTRHVSPMLARVYPDDASVTGYADHVSHDMLTYPTPDNPGTDAWEQLGPEMIDHNGVTYVGIRGMDGCRYVAEGVTSGAWRIVRAGHYGLGAVTSGHTLKSAVQRLNAFHEGETCDHCGHVNSTRGHGCDSCGRIRYGIRYAGVSS